MLYQLFSSQFRRLGGSRVRIDGPYDTFGYIIIEQTRGTFLIRGTGHNNPTT